MEGIKNKSAAVMSKLKQAKVQEQMEGPPVPSEDLEAFIAANELDEKAASELRKEAPAIQLSVIQGGDLSFARNKSSAVIARINKAKQSGALFTGNADPAAVDEFLTSNDMDEKA